MLKPCPFLFFYLSMIITPWLWNEHQFTAAHFPYSIKKEYEGSISRCGDVDIPLPFGVDADHMYDDFFSITCTYSTSSSSYVPILKRLNLELLDIRVSNWPGTCVGDVIAKIQSVSSCEGSNDSTNGGSNQEAWRTINLTGSPFAISGVSNVFASVGCDGYAMMHDNKGGLIAGCSSVCTPDPPPKGLSDMGCNGFRCCQTQVMGDLFKHFNIGVSVNKVSGHCRSAFLISKEYLETNHPSLVAYSPLTTTPVMLGWQMISCFSKIEEGATSGMEDIELILPALGTLLLPCAIFWLYWLCKTRKRRKDAKLRAKYFKLRLEEQRIVDRDAVNKIKLFTKKELEKFTGNFAKDRVLGQGGQGTVYKGMLTGGQVIAVKKSRTFDQSQWKQFINEVILLSQIKHRHVVKLLGCCLEMKEPLVVYEFIPNGTLFEHIHDPAKQSLFSWEMRLRIASEIATAIGYLHSDSPTPIYHRDIKSSNILLDDKYMAKLSDFGISKAFSAEQTHLTTNVQGTLGYLDPEYFQFSQFTEKSDVYSFGVVLVEILTGQKPIHLVTLGEEEEEDKVSMVEYFITSMNDSALCTILDPIVLESNAKEEIMVVANLTQKCLNPRGILRPTMKEVATVLEGLRCQSSSLTPNDRLSNEEIEIETITSMEMNYGSSRASTSMSMEISGPTSTHLI